MRVVILTEVKKKKYLKEILLLKKFLQSQNYLSSSTLQILYLKEANKLVQEEGVHITMHRTLLENV